MTPPELSGAWRRRSLSIGGSEPHEPADVWWLQVGDDFIDVRLPQNPSGDGGPVPLSGPGAFAGRTTWADPVLTWHHQLDSACPGTGSGTGTGTGTEPPQDRGVLSWDGPLLVEAGSAVLDGVEVPYVEVWERLAGPDPSITATFARSADGTGCVAQVGDHHLALTVEQAGQRWAAAHHRRVDGTWLPTIRIGHDGLLATLDLSSNPNPHNETEAI